MRPLWLYSGVFALSVASMVPFLWLFQNASINDEGIVCLGALRIWLGDAPYVDFTTHFAPGSYYLTALAYWLGGPSVAATRILMALITGVIGVTLFALARRCLPGAWAFAPWLLFLGAGVTQWPILSYHWCGVMGLLLGTLALVEWCERPDLPRAALAGATTALTGWLLQSEVAALLLATLIIAVWRRSQVGKGQLLAWWVALVGVSLVLWLPILIRAPISEIALQNVLWTIEHNAQPGQAPYTLSRLGERWAPFLQQLAQAQPSLPVANWALHSVSYLLVWSFNYAMFYPVYLVAAWLAFRRPAPGAVQVALVVQGVWMLVWNSRQTLLYLNFLTPLFFLLALWLLSLAKQWGRVLAIGLVGVYFVGYVYQTRECATFRFPVVTPRGTLMSNSPAEGQGLTRVYADAARLTPPGTRAFCYPYAMGFWFLSGLRPVGRMPVVIPILGPDNEIPVLAEQLKREGVEFIYRSPFSQDTLHAVPLVDEERFWRLMEEFDAMILAGYRPVARLGSLVLYQR